MPDRTTLSSHVADTCVPKGRLPNKTPIFITGVKDIRAFLVWLRASCSSDLTAQLKVEKSMVAQSKTNGFRGTVSTLQSFEGIEGLSFHTFSFP
jgi:hypothetical protein